MTQGRLFHHVKARLSQRVAVTCGGPRVFPGSHSNGPVGTETARDGANYIAAGRGDPAGAAKPKMESLIHIR